MISDAELSEEEIGMTSPPHYSSVLCARDANVTPTAFPGKVDKFSMISLHMSEEDGVIGRCNWPLMTLRVSAEAQV